MKSSPPSARAGWVRCFAHGTRNSSRRLRASGWALRSRGRARTTGESTAGTFNIANATRSPIADRPTQVPGARGRGVASSGTGRARTAARQARSTECTSHHRARPRADAGSGADRTRSSARRSPHRPSHRGHPAAPRDNVVLNWFEELKAKMEAGRRHEMGTPRHRPPPGARRRGGQREPRQQRRRGDVAAGERQLGPGRGERAARHGAVERWRAYPELVSG